MTERYLVSITGKQLMDSKDETSVEMVTPASYVRRGNNRYILYKDYESDTPGKSKTSIIKISPNDEITIIRGGKNQTRLVLEKNKRHSSYYYTEFGAILMGTYTSEVEVNLEDTGGTIKARYFLDLNSTITSVNDIYIKVKEKGKKDVTNNDSGDE